MAQQNPPPAQPVTQGSSLSFTQGFLVGQLSIALLIFCFIKFFIFGEPPSADERALHLASLRRARTLAHQNSLHHRTRSHPSTNPLHHKQSRSTIRDPASNSGPSIATILAKTYYNVKGHQPESLDWFNVLIAQTIAQLRADARHDGAVLTSLNEVLNSGVKPDWIGEIRVSEIALGDEFPIFSNCRVMPAEEGFGGSGTSAGSEEGRLQARMDVDLSDVITLGIETTLVLNYPKPRVAVLPVALAVSVVRFSGTLAMSFIPSSSPPSTSTDSPSASPNLNPTSSSHLQPPSQSDPPRPSSASGVPPARPTTLAFTFLDDYRLDLSVRSLVGSRSRLQDVPKIAQLIESRVHAWFDERVVEPRFQQIVLPSLWPRKRNTRGGDDGDDNNDNENDADIDVEAPEESIFPPLGHELTTGLGTQARPSSFIPPTASTAARLEARIEAEGAKLREAEVRADERSASREHADGMRWRGERPERGMLHREHSQMNAQQHRRQESTKTAGRSSGDWSGPSGMPGAMPGS
ncbi:hypothetical protein BDV95DRAFT_631693 [Massariosphaeria phaeospora]|uniref:Maintenance of mitochondrial morphology protein 1 n=1 Tax=Massariosphaeria phaeospora TaxID=100035 RepID=A0A7C8M2T6_9PLEO|nr:hypothetical protein BDV95DRAFT_631693 [Massariosphaeria phaeospora]